MAAPYRQLTNELPLEIAYRELATRYGELEERVLNGEANARVLRAQVQALRSQVRSSDLAVIGIALGVTVGLILIGWFLL